MIAQTPTSVPVEIVVTPVVEVIERGTDWVGIVVADPDRILWRDEQRTVIDTSSGAGRVCKCRFVVRTRSYDD